MDDLICLVEVWAADKDLDIADSSKQFLKVAEEFGEIAAALARGDQDELRDAIGDTVVTLIILAMQNDMDLQECLVTAYAEIKDRTGKTVNGVFIKGADLEERVDIAFKQQQVQVGDKVKLVDGVNRGTYFDDPTAILEVSSVGQDYIVAYSPVDGIHQAVQASTLMLVEEETQND